jgi:hypothetical protein
MRAGVLEGGAGWWRIVVGAIFVDGGSLAGRFVGMGDGEGSPGLKPVASPGQVVVELLNTGEDVIDVEGVDAVAETGD